MSPQPSAAVVRPVKEEDVPAIITLLLKGFPGRFSADGLRGLFDYCWGDDDSKPNRGFALWSGERVVGFHGAVYATRLLARRIVKTCNLSTWYVEPEFRWAALKLLYAVLGQTEYTVVSLTSSPTVRRILQMVGLKPIQTDKLLYLPWHFPAQLLSRGPELLSNRDEISLRLRGDEAQFMRDHYPYPVEHYLLADGSQQSYLIMKRRRFPGHAAFGRIPVKTIKAMWYPCMEVLYLGNPEFAERHWGPLIARILRRERVLGVVVPQRLLSASPPQGARFEYPAYLLPRVPLCATVDSLYSEFVVLPI